MTDLLRTPLYEEHQALSGKLVPFAGWSLPVRFKGIVDEHNAVRNAVGLFDVSHMGQLVVTGTGAVSLVDGQVTNDVAALPVGRALYTVCCQEDGGIVDDLIVYRTGPEALHVICNGANRAAIAARFLAAQTESARVVDETTQRALIALQGPKAQQIMAALGGNEITALRAFACIESQVAGQSCLVARTGYTGEDGYELSCAEQSARALWKALLEVGGPLGLQAAGLGARDTLRLEAALCLYGNEIDLNTHPFEAGLGWVVKLDAGDFVGRTALLQIKQGELQRRLVGFELLERGIARHGYAIEDDAQNVIGQVTSGAPSPTLGKSIALGYVPNGRHQVGSPLLVNVRGKRIRGQIVKRPFYKRAASR